MEGGRLTFSLLCSGPPATPRKRESEGEEDIKVGRKSGAGEEGGVGTLMKGMRKERRSGGRRWTQ